MIGDVQGCHATLRRLLQRVEFTQADTLWLTGDLVNRGPDSLGVLRFARSCGARLTAVLGNHDLHLVARVLGVAGPKPKDTLADVLGAPDRDELVAWLRSLPLLHRAPGEATRDPAGVAMVHAGLLPEWTLEDAFGWAGDIERCLRGPLAGAVLHGLYRTALPPWSARMAILERLQLALCALTRMRMLTRDGRIDLQAKGPPGGAPDGLRPWFDLRGPASSAPLVVFGHWSALGFAYARRAICLDSGCYRGGPLTALRLDDGAVFQEKYAG